MVFIILFFVVLIILFFPINLKGKLAYNVFSNKGYISFYFYKLRLSLLKIKFIPFKFIIKDKDKEFSITDIKNQTNFSDIFIGVLIKEIKIKNFRVLSCFGFNKDCLITSLGGAILLLSALTLSAMVIKKNSADNLTCNIFPDYKKTNFIFCFTSSIVLNLFTVIYCFVISLFIKLKKGI